MQQSGKAVALAASIISVPRAANNNNKGFICITARMLDYTISAKQGSVYNTNHHTNIT